MKTMCDQANTGLPASTPPLDCEPLSDAAGFVLAVAVWAVVFIILWKMGCFSNQPRDDWS